MNHDGKVKSEKGSLTTHLKDFIHGVKRKISESEYFVLSPREILLLDLMQFVNTSSTC